MSKIVAALRRFFSLGAEPGKCYMCGDDTLNDGMCDDCSENRWF